MSSTNRIHGAGSAGEDSQTKTNTGSHRKVEKVEKIQEVAETDNDRNPSKFRQMVDAEPEQDSGLPSPFDLVSSVKPETPPAADTDPSWEPVEGSAPYTPPPELSTGASSLLESPDDPLPKSPTFWTNVDEPFDPTPLKPPLQETSRSSSRDFGDDAAKPKAKHQPGASSSLIPKKEPTKGKAPSPLALPQSPMRKEPPLSALHTEPSHRAPSLKLPNSSPLNPTYLGTAEEKSTPQSRRSLKTEETILHKTPSPAKERQPTKDSPRQADERSSSKKQKKASEEVPSQIDSPSLTPLPDFALPLAQAAAQEAAPYLSPEVLAIYFHAVGTIYSQVSSSGDSETEFVLNSPSFANSKFFGSTISIQKFASAPNQINIRLTGSNEAVNAFNQNIPSLLSLFQRKGRFAFTVNRIDTAYEKPLFRRKGSAGEKGPKEKGP
ncbi:MAG: hypothetical protein HY861_02865 [Chlamydiia bacterium]|nr:hypothetical protein [Chlamydiia bacterium]